MKIGDRCNHDVRKIPALHVHQLGWAAGGELMARCAIADHKPSRQTPDAGGDGFRAILVGRFHR